MRKAFLAALVWLSTAFLSYEDAADYLARLPLQTRETAVIIDATVNPEGPIFIVMFTGESA